MILFKTCLHILFKIFVSYFFLCIHVYTSIYILACVLVLAALLWPWLFQSRAATRRLRSTLSKIYSQIKKKENKIKQEKCQSGRETGS